MPASGTNSGEKIIFKIAKQISSISIFKINRENVLETISERMTIAEIVERIIVGSAFAISSTFRTTSR
jgi:hypothetical protein